MKILYTKRNKNTTLLCGAVFLFLVIIPVKIYGYNEPGLGIIGVGGGIPMGVGPFAFFSMRGSFSGGLYGGTGLKMFVLGGRIRYHMGGVAPRGFYFFGDAAYIKATGFSKPTAGSTVISSKKTTIRPTIGAGYTTFWGKFCLDFGLGVGPNVSLKSEWKSPSGVLTSQKKSVKFINLFIGISYFIP